MRITQNGTWIELEEGPNAAAILVRAAWNSDYQAAIAIARAQQRLSLGLADDAKLPDDAEQAARAQASAGALLAGWRGFEDGDGSPLPDHLGGPMHNGSREIAAKLWRNDLVRTVAEAACLEILNRYNELARGALGNSKAGSAGNSGTAGISPTT